MTGMQVWDSLEMIYITFILKKHAADLGYIGNWN